MYIYLHKLFALYLPIFDLNLFIFLRIIIEMLLQNTVLMRGIVSIISYNIFTNDLN